MWEDYGKSKDMSLFVSKHDLNKAIKQAWHLSVAPLVLTQIINVMSEIDNNHSQEKDTGVYGDPSGAACFTTDISQKKQ